MPADVENNVAAKDARATLLAGLSLEVICLPAHVLLRLKDVP
jgi:hypothetical protein